MRIFILLVGAAAIAMSAPALAKPGKGAGNPGASAGKSHGMKGKARSRNPGPILVDGRAQNRYGGQACPPGLAKRTPACLPPGQARKIFAQGQRVPTGYNFYTDYQDIPLAYRNQYQLPSSSQYIYRGNAIYQVDPTTRMVSRIIDTLR